MKPTHLKKCSLAWMLCLAAGIQSVTAAGLLKPLGADSSTVTLQSHDVRVTINNGFAMTEVTQTYANRSSQDLEAVYVCPVPKGGTLAEYSVRTGELQMDGEVLPRSEAEQIYEEEKNAGNDAGLAVRNSYQNFEFRVSPVRADSDTTVRFVYYEPIDIDSSVGRYHYPLEDGGTDERARSFWEADSRVEGSISFKVELKSAWPVTEVRVPGYEQAAQIEKKADGHYIVEIEETNGELRKDLVFYYRLADGLPGRVELLTSREDHGKPGTFMLVVTPGLDLKPIVTGADYIFVLDLSGSMTGKLPALSKGVQEALGRLSGQDRFRIVTFSDRARELTRGWVTADRSSVETWCNKVSDLRSGGSTNLYDGVDLALRSLDADRASSVILVTDGVANTGILETREFRDLSHKHDVRIFGFLMGNSANWPLMSTICDASGGFYFAVSNSDDIAGKLLLAKEKVKHESLHGAEFTIDGVRVSETTGKVIPKIYRGQQLVLFGRYANEGRAVLRLKASLTGEDQVYETEVDFPAQDRSNPEIERLWAMARVEELERLRDLGEEDPGEVKTAIRDLGVQYQIVTDETAMVVLEDSKFEKRGIERRNRDRVSRELAAQSARQHSPARNTRADSAKPMFSGKAPSVGGGGALDPWHGLLLATLVLCGIANAVGRATRK
jgi:Ca-activated chloride channel family protein